MFGTTLTGLHLSGQDVHGHLVSLGGVNHQPILQADRREGELVCGREEANWLLLVFSTCCGQHGHSVSLKPLITVKK